MHFCSENGGSQTYALVRKNILPMVEEMTSDTG